MAADERWARSGWPPYAETWFGESTTYPTGRGQQQAATGWQCPGCSRCYAPWMSTCDSCGQEQPAPAFIGKSGPAEITDDEYER
jgi:hypothetical protein